MRLPGADPARAALEPSDLFLLDLIKAPLRQRRKYLPRATVM
jgi:hypothetical protein